MDIDISGIFDEYRKKKNEIEIPIEKMKIDLGDMIEKIVLYGAGSAGIAFLHYLRDVGISPKYFADGNSSRWGSKCEGLEIIDYRRIVELVGDDALVIVTINTDGKRYCKSFIEELRVGGHSGVYKNLRDAGCKNVIDYTYFRHVYRLFHGDPYNLPSCSDVTIMEKHEDDLKQVYELLIDDESREIFTKIIYFRMLDDSIIIPTRPQDKQYFEYKFLARKTDEIFIDCGAYNGISLKTFLAENKYFDRYYGFEPDLTNYMELETYVRSLPKVLQEKIMIFHKAVYNRNAKKNMYCLHGPGSFIADIGEEVVDTITIDEVLKGKEASFIKMNIEGSEIQALQGAENTIKMWKPRLAISGYHKTWDLWEVPLLIWKMNSKYRFYLRSYMNHLSFIYYGV